MEATPSTDAIACTPRPGAYGSSSALIYLLGENQAAETEALYGMEAKRRVYYYIYIYIFKKKFHNNNNNTNNSSKKQQQQQQ